MDGRRKRQLKQEYRAAMKIVQEAEDLTDCGLAILRVISPKVAAACRRMDDIEAEVKAALEEGETNG